DPEFAGIEYGQQRRRWQRAVVELGNARLEVLVSGVEYRDVEPQLARNSGFQAGFVRIGRFWIVGGRRSDFIGATVEAARLEALGITQIGHGRRAELIVDRGH